MNHMISRSEALKPFKTPSMKSCGTFTKYKWKFTIAQCVAYYLLNNNKCDLVSESRFI